MFRFIFFVLLCFYNQHILAEANPIIFREYDIRGIVDEEFTVEDTAEIGASIATYFKQQKPHLKSVVLCADGRVHSPAIKAIILHTLQDYGFDVVDIGTFTTPSMYFALNTLPVEAGLMITASHNPGQYNGIKIALGKNNVHGQEIQKIKAIYQSKAFASVAEKRGFHQHYDLITQYVEYMATAFPHLISADIKAIVDCGNGAAGTVLPQLVERMKWSNVDLMYADVDGTYPNHVADPSVETYMSDLKHALKCSQADLGLAFDGDCDRMAPMTKNGYLVKGDQLVALLSKPIIDQHDQTSVVFDVSSSMFIHELIKKWGGVPFISRTGVAAIKKKMSDTQALIGGEISCHTIFKDRYFGYDDGVYSMMRLFELLENSQKSLGEWLNEFTPSVSSPTYRLPCERSTCLAIVDELQTIFASQIDVELITIDGLRLHFPHGWAIVRPSSTEPLISMRFEARTHKDLARMKQTFYEIISQYIECSAMK